MLEDLRKEIDSIDEKLLSLLIKRIKIVKKVGTLKKKSGEKFFIRSAREADMIDVLIKKAGKNLPQNLVIDIWRKLITAANMLEQPISIFSQNPEYEHLIREYYNSSVPIKFLKTTREVISSLKKNGSGIAIFALPPHNQDSWWEQLPESFYVFTRIPYQKKSKINLVAVAAKKPEKSKGDVTLVAGKNSIIKVNGFHLTHKSGKVLGHYAK
jgi:chorismate mutase